MTEKITAEEKKKKADAEKDAAYARRRWQRSERRPWRS